MPTETQLRADEQHVAQDAQVVAFFDVLRTEQNRYLDVVGNAAGMLGAEHAHVARAAAIQLRLTRRMFDAQRSIVTHRAEVDAELRTIRADFGLPADAFDAGLPMAERMERELDAVLEDWWRREQSDRRLAQAQARGVDAVPTPVIEPLVVAASPSPAMQPAMLPGDLLAALDAADPAHLDALFTSLSEALATGVAPAATDGFTFDDLIIRLDPTDQFGQLDPLEALLAPPTAWERYSPAVVEQLRWILTRVLLPISLVTGSLALAMAWVG